MAAGRKTCSRLCLTSTNSITFICTAPRFKSEPLTSGRFEVLFEQFRMEMVSCFSYQLSSPPLPPEQDSERFNTNLSDVNKFIHKNNILLSVNQRVLINYVYINLCILNHEFYYLMGVFLFFLVFLFNRIYFL